MAVEKRPREEMMLRDLDVTRHGLPMENWEAERLWSCLFAVEMALTTANRETATAKAAAGQAQAQLASKALSLLYLLVLCGTTSY